MGLGQGGHSTWRCWRMPTSTRTHLALQALAAANLVSAPAKSQASCARMSTLFVASRGAGSKQQGRWHATLSRPAHVPSKQHDQVPERAKQVKQAGQVPVLT